MKDAEKIGERDESDKTNGSIEVEHCENFYFKAFKFFYISAVEMTINRNKLNFLKRTLSDCKQSCVFLDFSI